MFADPIMANSSKTKAKPRKLGRDQTERLYNSDKAYQEAVELSKKFHGRDPKDVFEIIETEHYDKNLAEIGDLIELTVLKPNGNTVVPISFKGTGAKLCGKGNNLSVVGGDQSINVEDLKNELGIEEVPEDRQYLYFGSIFSVVYFTDKHHLEGPDRQKKGIEYEHEFGEQDPDNSELPSFIYDSRNKKVMIVGGSYTIKDVGIYN